MKRVVVVAVVVVVVLYLAIRAMAAIHVAIEIVKYSHHYNFDDRGDDSNYTSCVSVCALLFARDGGGDASMNITTHTRIPTSLLEYL